MESTEKKFLSYSNGMSPDQPRCIEACSMRYKRIQSMKTKYQNIIWFQIRKDGGA